MKYLITGLFLLLSNTVFAATINFGPNGCTLQDAIESANFDAAIGNCSSGSGTDLLISPDFWFISLSEQLPVITSSMTITTQTSSGLLDLSGDFANRIMKVTGASTNLTLRRVKLQAGYRPALADGGAAIRIINAHVTLDNTIFYNNQTLAPHGAAIYLKGGTLDIQNSTFERNRGSNGAASVYGENSTITISTTTFKHDWQSISVDSTQLSIDSSTFDSSSMVHSVQSTIDIKNSTQYTDYYSYYDINDLSFPNKVLDITDFSSIVLNHVTIARNVAVFRNSNVTATNTIFWDCVNQNATWIFSSSNIASGPYWDLCGSVNFRGNAKLSPLRDNGGPTETSAIIYNSDDAIAMADPFYCLPTDQRGEARAAQCDIGAFELTNVTDIIMHYAAVTPPPYVWGQEIVFEAKIKNFGSADASDVVFDMTTVHANISSIDSPLCSSVPCTIPFVAEGQEIILPVHLNLYNFQTDFNLEFSANSSLTSSYTDNNPSNNTITFSYNSLAKGTDLGVTLDLITPPPYFNGQSVQYAATITNHGNNNTTNITLDFTKTNLQMTAYNSCDSFAAQSCIINALNDGQSRTINVNATVTANQFDLAATVSGNLVDINTNNNTDDQGNNGAVTQTDLVVTMNLITSGPYYSGDYLQYDIAIKTLSQAASNIKLWSSIDGAELFSISYCTFYSYCEIPDMAPNSVVHVTAQYFAPTFDNYGSSFSHRAFVTAGQTDTDMSNNEVIMTSSLGATADVSTTLTLLTPPPYYQGQQIEYNLRAINGGIDDITNVNIYATPTNLTLLNTYSQNCATMNCTLGILGRFLQEDITLIYRIDSTGVFYLDGKVSASEFDPDNSNNNDNNVGGTADLAVFDLIFKHGFE